MKLPRRVPWASLSELDQVCSWMYADETDTDAKLKAIHRLSAWRAITPLPHALEAALSLLSSIILDQNYVVESHRQQGTLNGSFDFPTSKNISALNIRQSYATAILRLVNGLVDPLQLGTYARSIASIAAQIGLPLWLVELRHAATHEDLPSLELLRTGAKESLTWLLHKYFLPILSVASVEESAPVVRLSPLHPLLKRYKSLMKTISRDASLKSQYKDELAKSIRDIERWIGEAKVASSAVIFNGWGANELDDGDENERWALERLSEALTERGGLVPVSTRKRLASNLKSPPALPSALNAIWLPLLLALKTSHPTLPVVLVFVIIDCLLHDPTSQNEGTSNRELSYELCLAAWAAWCVDDWETTAEDDSEENPIPLKRKDVVLSLVAALAIRADDRRGLRKGANALLDLLIRKDSQLEEISTSLLAAAQRTSPIASKDSWSDELQTMEERLNILISSASSTSLSNALDDSFAQTRSGESPVVSAASALQHRTAEMPAGWSQVSVETWRPCPIGVFRGAC
ncbi:LAS1 [Sanghuangporus vaninii]